MQTYRINFLVCDDNHTLDFLLKNNLCRFTDRYHFQIFDSKIIDKIENLQRENDLLKNKISELEGRNY